MSSGEIPADSYGRSDKVHGSSGEVLVDSHGRDESVRDFLFRLNTSLESSARPISGLNDLYASEVPLRQVLTGWSPSTRGAQSHKPPVSVRQRKIKMKLKSLDVVDGPPSGEWEWPANRRRSCALQIHQNPTLI